MRPALDEGNGIRFQYVGRVGTHLEWMVRSDPGGQNLGLVKYCSHEDSYAYYPNEGTVLTEPILDQVHEIVRKMAQAPIGTKPYQIVKNEYSQKVAHAVGGL